MPKVLISDKLSPRAAKIFMERGVDVDVKPGLSSDELLNIIGDYDGLAIRSATKVTEEVLGAAVNLKVVGRAGIGIDNVDVINVLGTNVWTIKRDHSNSRPVIQLQAELNTLTKVFIIDHFDEDAEEDILFNIDSIKYWSRPDGEGFENAYNELQSRVEQEISDSTKTGFITKFKNWFG